MIIGPFGKIYIGLNPREAIEILLQEKAGEAVAVIRRIDIGAIDFMYGKKGDNGFGLAHIEEKHPEILVMLDKIIERGTIIKKSDDRVYLETKDGKAIIRLDWDGNKKAGW